MYKRQICLSLVLFRICRGGVRARQDIRERGADGVSRTAAEIMESYERQKEMENMQVPDCLLYTSRCV